MLRPLLSFLLFATGALANTDVFDKPIGADPLNRPQRCTYYADLTVRETGTDSPGTGPTYLMPAAADPKHTSCPKSGGRKIDQEGRDFAGRKGDFLVFVPSDANGMETLEVRSLKDGVKLYDDMMVPGAFKSALVSGDQLRLVYTRGYAAACSLLQSSAECWAKMMKDGKFSRAIAQQPPPVKACQVAYANSPGKDPPSNTSVLTYDVDVTIEPGKKGVVNSRGALGCMPSS